MNKKALVICSLFCLLAGAVSLKAQSTKYFIKFKDKYGSPYVLGNANPYLSAKSINRRVMYNTPVDMTDIPVSPPYISQVEAIANVTVLYPLKWLNGVVVSIPNNASAALNAINGLSFVVSSTAANRYKLNPIKQPAMPPTAAIEQQYLRSTGTTSFNMGGSAWQNQQLNVDCLHDLGYRGQGITIAVMDVGFNSVDSNPVFDSLRNRGGILGTRDFVDGGNSVYEDGSHGAEVLSCMAAINPSVIMGSAPRADYWLLRTEDGGSETPVEEYNWIRAAEFADSAGVDILTTSLGYTYFDNGSQSHTYATLNGKTAPMSIAATMAARKGMFVLNAAGNEGQSAWQYISVAADADSICTVGAVDSLGNWASFSSIGPTADGRIKPDLVARGAGSWVAYVNGTCFPGNGTSYATPIMAGAVACFWQAHREHNNMTILQLLKSSATNSAVPNNTIGWGRPDVCAAAPLGIHDLEAEQLGLLVSPNPFHSELSIHFHTANAITVQLTDVLGRVLQSVNATDGATAVTLGTAQLPAGVYLVRLRTSKGMASKKIIKQ